MEKQDSAMHQGRRNNATATLLEGIRKNKVSFLLLFCVLVLFFALPNASAFLNTKSYDEADKEYTLSAWLGLDTIAKIQLITPERMPCSDYCYGILKVTADNSFTTDIDKFFWKFYDYKNREISLGKELYSYKIEKLIGYEPIMYPEYGECYDKINESYYNCPSGKYYDSGFEREVWEEWGANTEIKANEEFYIKISGSKKPEAVIDWRPTLFGFTLDRFAWWDDEEVLTQYNDTAAQSDQWNTESAARRYLAQTFNHSLGATYKLSHIGLYMIKRDPNGNASIEIWNTSGGAPNSKVYDCKDLVPADIASDNTNTWVTIDCTTEGGYDLETDTTYAVVLYDVVGGSTDHRWGILVDRTDGAYAGGSFYYDNDGSAWTNEAGDDAIFTIWGAVILPTVTITSPTNTTYDYLSIPLNVNADTSTDTWFYDLNGAGNVTFTPNITITAASGDNNLIIWANSTSGLWGSSSVIFTTSVSITTTLISPANQTNISISSQDFACSAAVNGNVTLTNMTLYLWNSTALYTTSINATPLNATNGTSWNVNNIPDNAYEWNCLTYGDSSSVIFSDWGINRTITIDTIPPYIAIISPSDGSLSNSSNVSINYTKSDSGSGVETVKYSLNDAANVTLTANVTVVVLNSTNTLDLYASDYTGNENSTSIIFDVYGVGPGNYTTPVSEWDTTNFYINITTNTSKVDVNATFTWNNTIYKLTKTTTSTNYEFSRAFIIPSFNLSQSNVNITLRWNFSLAAGSSTSDWDNSTYTQQVDIFRLDNCSSFAYLLYNFTYYGEKNSTVLDMINRTTDFEAFFRIGIVPNDVKEYLFDQSWNNSYHDICINALVTKEIDADIKYSASGYKERMYYLLNWTTIKGGDNITLFLLHDDYAPTVKTKLSVNDENYEGIKDVYVNIMKYYLGINKWENISWAEKTGNGGTTMVWLESDTRYKFEFWKDYELLDTQEEYTSTTSLTFTIVPTVQYIKYGEVRGVNFSLSFNNETNITTYTYNASSINSGDWNNTCLIVTKRSLLSGKTELCNNCSTSQAGTLICDITSSGEGTYKATVTITRNIKSVLFGEETRKFLLDVLDFNVNIERLYDYASMGGVWSSLVVITVLVMIGIAAPAVAIILGVLGFIFSAMMGLVEFSFTIIISIIIVGFILIYKIKKI